MQTSDLQFNIIYTPGSAIALAGFVHSLLKWSDCRFQLVANGCMHEEQAALSNLADSDSRLSYLCISENKMLSHNEALDTLQQQCTGEWFCAMDSDILACGPFLPEVAEFSSSDVITSCLPVWTIKSDETLPSRYQRIQGTHVRLANGLAIGCTYFMLYRNEVINRIRDRYNISFERFYWDVIPEPLQQTINSLGAAKNDYDTAIVMNLLITANGSQVTYVPLSNLVHLGGLSATKITDCLQFSRGKLDNLSIELKGTPLSPLTMWFADLYYGRKNIVEHLNLSEYANLAGRARRRAASAIYFSAVLASLLNNETPPEPPHLANDIVERRLREATDKIVQNWQATNRQTSAS
jgi:hypothetical protein